MGESSGLDESSRSSKSSENVDWEASERGEATAVETDNARNREVNENACITRDEGKTGKTGTNSENESGF
jgi:hypothetical protein